MKPVLYLDVDGVLIQFREDRTMLHYEHHKGGFPANRVGDFLKWADDNFEVRWLTCWCPSGQMHPERKTRLEAILWEDLPDWVNPMTWWGEKTYGINFDEPRMWFWLDDETKHDRPLMYERFRDRLIKTNSSVDPNALIHSSLEVYYRLSQEDVKIEFPRFALDFCPVQRGGPVANPRFYE
ncbi:MAG TPA: hypothetical protein VJ044_05995 [Candidatus Hodarchaeales archaeon]|nr:hypothetical protein [Candidatus Hodarchaeales archaeon]